ncbi:hypothetical protein BgAZ_401090 [Babesia gibsoni]|uniref:Secreted antigen 1 n=1 Tax=Babesia gibsoni TaxID=33632 RepID=A0AAD8LH38_BABGI|nr:hypothetical protein BgAZ_401090 [Babesia gibsoni]
MEGLGIIRLVAFWSLAVNATIPIVQGASGVSVNAESIKPGTVKDAVDLLGKLATETTLKEKFISELLNKVKEYLDVSEEAEKGYKEKLNEFFSHVGKLRNELLSRPSEFGLYANLDASGVTDAVLAAERWLPLLHTEFWFIFFLTTTEGFGIGGGQWANMYFGPKNTDTSIHKWLTDQLNKVDRSIMRRGYKDGDLKSVGRATVQLSGYLGLQYYSAGSLTDAQIGLFLWSGDTFNPSNLSGALVFIAEFCRDINNGRFQDKLNGGAYGDIVNVCKSVSTNIDSLNRVVWPLYNPEGNTEVEDDSDSEDVRSKVIRNRMYEGKLKNEKFEYYVKFMKDNISKIALYLKQMHSDAADWNVESLTSGESYGPFKYGYLFKDKRWDSALYYTFIPYIEDLLNIANNGSLYSLLKCLDPEKAQTEKEKVTRPQNITGRGESREAVSGVGPNVSDNSKGKTEVDSTGEVTRRNDSEPEQESASGSTKEDVGSNGVPGASGSVNSVAKGPTSGENGANGRTEEHGKREEVEEESPLGDGGDASEVNNKEGEPTASHEEGNRNAQNSGNGVGEENSGNRQLILARSGEGNEEDVSVSPPPTTPGTPTSPGRQGNPEGKGDASHAGKHTNESESTTEQGKGGKNAVVPDQKPGSPKTGNRAPVGPQTPPKNEKTPQKRRTHPQGDNAPKAIREEAELPSESSFSGIHACGILIVTCIFTVV